MTNKERTHPGFTNADRRKYAHDAVTFFAKVVGQTTEDLETNVTDLLADLMHLVGQRTTVPFARLLDRAENHYDTEVEE